MRTEKTIICRITQANKGKLEKLKEERRSVLRRVLFAKIGKEALGDWIEKND